MVKIEVGGLYKIQNAWGKYRKIRIVSIVDEVRTRPKYDDEVDDHIVEYTDPSDGSGGASWLSNIKNDIKELTRKPNCRGQGCKRKLDEETMELCQHCGWIKCPDDNMCGCGYKG